MDVGNYVFPIGKYRSKRLKEIPSAYLRWVTTEFNAKKFQSLIETCVEELDYRDEHQCHFEETKVNPLKSELLRVFGPFEDQVDIEELVFLALEVFRKSKKEDRDEEDF